MEMDHHLWSSNANVITRHICAINSLALISTELITYQSAPSTTVFSTCIRPIRVRQHNGSETLINKEVNYFYLNKKRNVCKNIEFRP